MFFICRSVYNINLLLSMKGDAAKLEYKTYLLVFNKKDTAGVKVDDTTALHFQQMTCVPGNATAVLAGTPQN